jgi:glyceraldehyde 3-phosphate dehydrogenase
MMKVAINGLGRIGRATLKIILDKPDAMELTAINDLVPIDNLAYLLKYDTAYGKYDKNIQTDNDHLVIDGKKIQTFHEKDPQALPWKDLGVDVVFECTGIFTKKDDLKKHLTAGAQKVILSAPAKSEGIETIVTGVNQPSKGTDILSCASCTTNCITPVVEVFGRKIGLKKAAMTTIHAYTSTQGIVDGPNKKMRRGRAAACNFVPTSTGAAIATTKALPQYKGKFNGVAVRGPVAVGSIADLTFVAERETSLDEVNEIFKEASESSQYKGILGVTQAPLVSSDIIKDPHASIVDLSMTQVVDGDLVKIMSWYDNEWGYASQMIKQALENK